jgi:hypothetical protein
VSEKIAGETAYVHLLCCDVAPARARWIERTKERLMLGQWLLVLARKR